MDGRTRGRIKRMRDTLIRREKERDKAEEALKDWMKANMDGASKEALGQAGKVLYGSYSFHKGIVDAYRQAEHGDPLDENTLKNLKIYAKEYIAADRAYNRQEDKLRARIMKYMREHDAWQELDDVIAMLPACYLRFNLLETKYAREENNGRTTDE